MIKFKSIKYKYTKPDNFNSEDPDFEIFNNIRKQNSFEPKIIHQKNIRVANNSVVFKYFKVYKESCIHRLNYVIYNKGYKFFFKYLMPKLNFSRKRMILITDEWTSNYYHWHLFALKKLAILKNEGLVEDSLLILPKKYKKYSFVLPSLKKFGIEEKDIVYLPKKSNMKVKDLYYVKAPHHHPDISKLLRKTILENHNEDSLNYGDKIYISREGQKIRHLVNEKEVQELLEKYGFKKIIAEKYSYNEQISIMKNAKYVVAPHGAGLTNILFMKDGSSILELGTEPNPFKPITDYHKLSNMLEFKYFYYFCRSVNKMESRLDYHLTVFDIDLEKLEKNIKLMLNNG